MYHQQPDLEQKRKQYMDELNIRIKNELEKMKHLLVTTPYGESHKEILRTHIKSYEDSLKKNHSNEKNTPKIKKAVVKKKKSISSTIRKLVWNTNIGEEIGKTKCLCCNSTDITQISFNCGHIVSEANGGETIVSNLKPICQNCNSSMGTKDMNEFMKTLR
jgi:5-methylcytosine-specific restriction endonuclease McrA